MAERIKYLGDGVYVELAEDGGIKLMTDSHENPGLVIWLEPEVIDALNRWLEAWRSNG